MSLSQWLKGFTDLHSKAKRGALAGRDLTTYHAAREELARALLSAQHVALEAGQRPRQALRVARALQADIEFHDGSVRAMTMSVSAGGFGVLLAKPPKVDEEVQVSLRIPGGEPLSAAACAVDVKQQVGNARVAFRFVGLDTEAVERLELFVFDSVLAQIEGK